LQRYSGAVGGCRARPRSAARCSGRCLEKRPQGGASGGYNATPSAPGTSSCLFALAQQVRHQQPAGATALPYSTFVTKLSASSRASSAACGGQRCKQPSKFELKSVRGDFVGRGRDRCGLAHGRTRHHAFGSAPVRQRASGRLPCRVGFDAERPGAREPLETRRIGSETVNSHCWSDQLWRSGVVRPQHPRGGTTDERRCSGVHRTKK